MKAFKSKESPFVIFMLKNDNHAIKSKPTLYQEDNFPLDIFRLIWKEDYYEKIHNFEKRYLPDPDMHFAQRLRDSKSRPLYTYSHNSFISAVKCDPRYDAKGDQKAALGALQPRHSASRSVRLFADPLSCLARGIGIPNPSRHIYGSFVERDMVHFGICDPLLERYNLRLLHVNADGYKMASGRCALWNDTYSKPYRTHEDHQDHLGRGGI